MEPVVLILIVLVFSILDAIGRKQRRAQGGAAADGTEPETEPSSLAERRASLRAAEAARRTSVPRAAASEGVIVPELWEEIRKLARAKAGAARAEGEEPAPPVTRAVAPPAAPVHPVHRTHPKMGRPLAERRTPLAQPPDEAARHRPGEAVTDVRRMLGGGARALRKAVILEEVLGPPASLRGDPHRPGG